MQPVRRPALAPAFTLVELLVVIGIIAVLISVLLPALGAARRQSQTVKCLAALKEIGNAFQMYAIDSKGYYPPAQLRTNTDQNVVYNLYGTDFPADGYGAYWFNFLNKYVSKEKIGNEDTGGQTVDNVRTKSLFWGCPTYDPYRDIVTGGTNRVQTGYGMNGYPTFDLEWPKASTVTNPLTGQQTTVTANLPPTAEWAWNNSDSQGDFRWMQGAKSRYGFVKQKTWTKRGAQRAIIADARFWLAESSPVAANVVPVQMPEVNANNTATNQTSLSIWRHGKMPTATSVVGGYPQYPSNKGKIAFNILYCDGHVATSADWTEAYRSLRLKYPG